jgi:N-acetylglucosamine kinase-like BadF-type ATPase
MAKYVTGLDGGGTKTNGVLVDDSGKVLAQATGEASNFQVIGGEKLGQVISKIVAELVHKAKVQTQDIDHLFAGLAGAGREADREAISQIFEGLHLAKSFTIDTDAAAALAGAFAGGPGIILISGTGAISFGKDETGKMVRCGGWGYLLGDEGSGYFIGQQALLAALKDLDGRGRETTLRSAIEKMYALSGIDMIISSIYSGKIDRTEIAGLAPMVFSESAKGDFIAQSIIAAAGSELGKMVAAVVKKLGRENQRASVALIGSVFNQREALLPFMKAEALNVAEKVEFIDPRFEPAIGAAILALKNADIKISEEVLRRVEASERIKV